eukprot:14005383-Ditylum_brightwellii.AAC.1
MVRPRCPCLPPPRSLGTEAALKMFHDSSALCCHDTEPKWDGAPMSQQIFLTGDIGTDDSICALEYSTWKWKM